MSAAPGAADELLSEVKAARQNIQDAASGLAQPLLEKPVTPAAPPQADDQQPASARGPARRRSAVATGILLLLFVGGALLAAPLRPFPATSAGARHGDGDVPATNALTTAASPAVAEATTTIDQMKEAASKEEAAIRGKEKLVEDDQLARQGAFRKRQQSEVREAGEEAAAIKARQITLKSEQESLERQEQLAEREVADDKMQTRQRVLAVAAVALEQEREDAAELKKAEQASQGLAADIESQTRALHGGGDQTQLERKLALEKEQIEAQLGHTTTSSAASQEDEQLRQRIQQEKVTAHQLAEQEDALRDKAQDVQQRAAREEAALQQRADEVEAAVGASDLRGRIERLAAEQAAADARVVTVQQQLANKTEHQREEYVAEEKQAARKRQQLDAQLERLGAR